MPSIKQMQYFSALAKEKNMSRLAAKLFVSQTALSNAISRLEDELGVTLFVRTTSGLALTKHGIFYLEYVERILSLLDEAAKALKSFDEEQQTSLSIALNSPLLYAELLGEFMSTHPNCTVRQQQCNIEQIERTLPQMDVDIILAGKDDFSSPYLVSYLVSLDRIYIGVPPQHVFASKKEISLWECKGEPFIFQNVNTGFTRFSVKLFRDVGYEPRVVAWCDSAVRNALFGQKLGLLLTSDATKRVNFVDNCIYVPLVPSIYREMDIFSLKSRPLTSPAEQFLNFAIEYFKRKDAYIANAEGNARCV